MLTHSCFFDSLLRMSDFALIVLDILCPLYALLTALETHQVIVLIILVSAVCGILKDE